MMKVFRLVFSGIILGALVVSQLPSAGQCQMLSGSILAKSCAMPCCTRLRQGYGGSPAEASAKAGKTNMPVSKCPLISADTARDIITSSFQTLDNTLQPLHAIKDMVMPALGQFFTRMAGLAEIIHVVLARPSLSVRAPPENIHTLAA